MKSRAFNKAVLARRVRVLCTELSTVGETAIDLQLHDAAIQAFELNIQLMQLERQLLELPPLPTEPPAEEQWEQLPF